MSDELETPQPEEQSEATEAEAAEATEAPTDEEPSDSVQNASDPQVEDDDDGDDDGPGDESTVAVQQPSLTQDHRDAMAPTAARRVAFDDDRDYSDDEFAEMLGMYEETLQVKAQQIVNGTVLAVTENEVVVDIGFKSEGAIALSEFGDEP
ncbi:MAG: hypothetical protein QGH20_07545, partial [Candidatus Latescibacteria bacterium]|nr:hypothetical protein [Candidatus Latescibacterota bacterium]